MDEPPRSDAGQDVVIQLPTDWAVLDGRDSVDDHSITHYEWTLVKGDAAINMKVCFHVLSLTKHSGFISLHKRHEKYIRMQRVRGLVVVCRNPEVHFSYCKKNSM